MAIDLSNYKWPERDTETRSKREGGELIGSAYKTFVSEGALYVRAIDFNGLMRPIPRECSAITALGYENGLVYGATSGEQSWLLQYALLSFREAALPLCPIPDCTDVRGLIVINGQVYAGANNSSEGRIIKVSGLVIPGDVVQEWGMPHPQFESMAIPAPGERIERLILSHTGNVLYGLTSPGGLLFRYEIETGECNVIGPVSPIKFFGQTLVEDNAGFVYAFGAVGKMMRFNPYTNEIEETGVRIPSFPGRGPYARISATVFDPSQLRLFVGDTEGLLSVISLENQTVITLGKPVSLGGIDHLVRISDGRVFGVAGGLDGMSHLFVYDGRTGSLRDLGVCCATMEKGWYGYKFGAMLATREGRIVMGEDDHMGCLFSYFPPLCEL